MKSDEPDDVEEVKPQLEKLFTELSEEVECDSCTI
jgi:rubredoxin